MSVVIPRGIQIIDDYFDITPDSSEPLLSQADANLDWDVGGSRNGSMLQRQMYNEGSRRTKQTFAEQGLCLRRTIGREYLCPP